MYEREFRLIGAKIAYYRKCKGLTQERLAEMIGVSSRYISAIETGRNDGAVSLKVLLNIAEKLGVRLNKIFEDV